MKTDINKKIQSLINRSETLGFSSRDNLSSVTKDYTYLWLCELQEWLRNTHNIDVIIQPSSMGKNLNYYFLIFVNRDFDNIIQGKTKNYSYNKALKKGIEKALELI